MQAPLLSEYFNKRGPSAIRLAQIEFAKRKEPVEVVNTATGNISLPMHPAMQERMFKLQNQGPFVDGVVKYSATVGISETNQAFLNVIASSGFQTKGLFTQITDGGSQAMELVTLGVGGQAGSSKSPLLLIDAAYTNYQAMAQRLGRTTVTVSRTLQDHGKFTLPDMDHIEKKIKKSHPNALVVIPYDNPTGQFMDQETLKMLGNLCVQYNMWMISDEAYRELFYVDKKVASIWGLSNGDVPGIEGRRISIETTSKVWNACGLRIGALVTDNQQFHEKSVAENTTALCSNVIGQYIFGAMAHLHHKALQKWYQKQRDYYWTMLENLNKEVKKRFPQLILSNPDASIYTVVDVRSIATESFKAKDFVIYCAREGKVKIDGMEWTMLMTPMSSFYQVADGERNPGDTQLRIAYVETPIKMKMAPVLLVELLKQYLVKTAV